MRHSVFGFALPRSSGTAVRDPGRERAGAPTMERSIPSVSLTFGALIFVVTVGVLVLLRGYAGAVGIGSAAPQAVPATRPTLDAQRPPRHHGPSMANVTPGVWMFTNSSRPKGANVAPANSRPR